MNLKLIPIKGSPKNYQVQTGIPLFGDIIQITFDFYERTGFTEPWIGYLAELNGEFVGTGGFKGKPVNNTIEIAYGTFEEFQHQGIGSDICRILIDLALATNPSIKITARTLPEENFSTKILQKNGFKFSGNIQDPEDGEVWEWV